MEPRTIVAIEIASSKIKGAAAAVGPDGRITVLAVEEISGTNNVRYGRIQNIREVSGAVNEIVRRLEDNPAIAPRRIEAVILSLGGRSLSGMPGHAALRSPHECEITENHVQRLMYEASRDIVGDKNIEATVPRVFYVNNGAVPNPVGIFGESIKGEFLMVTCGKETRQNLDRLKFETIEHDNVSYEIRPLAIGDLVLTPDERELGCALVDFGAETTTVTVYKGRTPAFVSTIPMGSRLITLDLMAGLGITEEAAENYKLKLAGKDPHDTDNSDVEEVNAYARARSGEIAANIISQIEHSGYNAESLSTIVLTGGGSKLPGFASQLSSQCKLPVRVAEMPSDITFRVPGRNNADNIDVVALLAAGVRKHMPDCLSEMPEPREEYDEPEEAVEEQYEDPFEDEPVRQSRPSVSEYREERFDRNRRDLREDDENLLVDDKDDDDEETDKPVSGGHRRGFIDFFRRSKDTEPDYEEESEEPYVDEDDSFEVEESQEEFEDDPDDAEEAKHADDNFDKTKEKISKIGDIFSKIFKSDPDDSELE